VISWLQISLQEAFLVDFYLFIYIFSFKLLLIFFLWTFSGEDALANICIEKTSGKIVGHLRIRSKTQGIALSLGDKITLSQKELPEED